MPRRRSPPMSGEVLIHVDGKPQGKPLYLAPGDSVLFTMPGLLLDGRVTIAEERARQLEEKLQARGLRVAGYEQTIRQMARAASLDEAIGIAWRSGALNYEE